MTRPEAKSQWINTRHVGSADCCKMEPGYRPPHTRMGYRIRNAITGCFMWFYRRYSYRCVQRLLHKFNLHYMPPVVSMTQPKDDNPPGPVLREIIEYDHWCQWCGVRGKSWKLRR